MTPSGSRARGSREDGVVAIVVAFDDLRDENLAHLLGATAEVAEATAQCGNEPETTSTRSSSRENTERSCCFAVPVIWSLGSIAARSALTRCSSCATCGAATHPRR